MLQVPSKCPNGIPAEGGYTVWSEQPLHGCFTPKDAFYLAAGLIIKCQQNTTFSLCSSVFFSSDSGFLCSFVLFVCFYFWQNWLLFCFACDDNTSSLVAAIIGNLCGYDVLGGRQQGCTESWMADASKSGLSVFLHICFHSTKSSYHSREYLVYTEIRTSL